MHSSRLLGIASRHIMAEASPGFSQVLSAMVQIYEQDKKLSSNDEVRSDVCRIIRRNADFVMQNYNLLPEEIKREYPREIVEPAYEHLKNVSEMPTKLNS